MEEIKEDYKDFFANDTTQKFIMTVAILIILQVFNLVPGEKFYQLLKWSLAGFWGANGLDFLTNMKRK